MAGRSIAAGSARGDSFYRTLSSGVMGTSRRTAFTLIEVVVGVTIAAVLAFAFYVTLGGADSGSSSSADDRARRAGEAATLLHDIARAIAALETTNPPESFLQTVGAYPNTLSQLTTPITTTDRNSCNRASDRYLGTAVPTPPTNPGYVLGWKGPYYRMDFVAGGATQIANGFALQDDLIRSPATPPPTPRPDEQAGRLLMRMNTVTQLDAQALDAIVDYTISGTAGTVRYAGTDPTTVDYAITVSRC